MLVSPTVGIKTVDTAPASWSAPGTVRPHAGRTWRDNLLAATSTLPKRLGGDTGLYDTDIQRVFVQALLARTAK